MENNKPTTQNKRPYETPAMEVVELPETPKMLSASGPVNRDDYESKEW
jgi:hypothetical protein